MGISRTTNEVTAVVKRFRTKLTPRHWSSIATLCVTASLVLLGVAPAQAESNSELEKEALSALRTPERSALKAEVLAESGVAAAGGQAKVFKCTITPGRPHLSEGEAKKKRNSVVVKAFIKCPDAGQDVNVAMYGVLAKSTAKDIRTLKITASNQATIKVKNKKTATFMVPGPSSGTHIKAGKGTWFRGSFSGKIMTGKHANINAKASDHVYLKDRKF